MINKDRIENIINSTLKEKDLHLIELDVNQSNKIKVVIDNTSSVSIDECVAISRLINAELDKDIEDYDLEVTSPGINAPLTHDFQYRKNVGKRLEILKKDGIKIKGILKEYNDDSILITKKATKKITNQTELEEKISHDDIKSAKVMITF